MKDAVSCRWMVWMDADAVFNPVRFDKSLTSIIERYAETKYVGTRLSRSKQRMLPHLIVGNELEHDTHPTRYRIPGLKGDINDGVFFIDTSKFSTEFLNALPDYKVNAQAPFWEQDAMMLWRCTHLHEFATNARLVPHNMIQSWSQCDPVHYNSPSSELVRHSLVVHWAGCGAGESIQAQFSPGGKYGLIQTFLQTYQKHLNEP